MSLKSIDTRYAGCLFRSRLEARWAVCFDHLGIAWDYEPQGFEVTRRITDVGSDGTFRYLPDLWLSDVDCWGEVKGSLDRKEAVRLIDAAASLSSNDGGGCGSGHDLVVLGPLTNGQVTGSPIRLHMHKGDLIASCFWCVTPHRGITIADDTGHISTDVERTLLRGYYCATHAVDTQLIAALDVARTARFEHGRRPRNVAVQVRP